jgi:hypothetical protein
VRGDREGLKSLRVVRCRRIRARDAGIRTVDPAGRHVGHLLRVLIEDGRVPPVAWIHGGVDRLSGARVVEHELGTCGPPVEASAALAEGKGQEGCCYEGGEGKRGRETDS